MLASTGKDPQDRSSTPQMRIAREIVVPEQTVVACDGRVLR
jgi:hypothetical protein